MEAVFLEGNGDLRAVLVELIHAEILLESGDDVILDHEEPASVELHAVRVTSLS